MTWIMKHLTEVLASQNARMGPKSMVLYVIIIIM